MTLLVLMTFQENSFLSTRFLCAKCTLLQTGYIVGDATLYSKNYHYLPGISKAVADNFKKLSFNLKKYNLNKTL